MAKLVINPTSATKKEIPIVSRVISIGRDPSNDLVLSDSMVSRRHAILEQRDNQYVLRDNNSSNGTMVNGDRVDSEKPLRDGDLVAIGSSRLLFQLDDTADASIPEAAKRLLQESAAPSPPSDGRAGAEVRCAFCGKASLATDRFCRGCGREFPKTQARTVCPSCGTEVQLPADFCGHCGKGLQAAENAASSTRPIRRLEVAAPPPDGAPSPASAPAIRPRAKPPGAALKKASTDEAAGFGIRLLAFLVDDAILGAPLLLGGLLWMASSVSDSSAAAPGAVGMTLLGIVYPILCMLYYVLFWGGRGATPGKSLLGLVVKTESGETPIGYSRALLRLLGYCLSSALFGLGFLAILISDERLALHDRIAGTRVTRTS